MALAVASHNDDIDDEDVQHKVQCYLEAMMTP